MSKPNFLIIVADDLGFSDLGAYGSEISTPNLDKLAGDGLRFTGFHTASACSPTRSMLFSGTDHHLAGLGQMAETARTLPFLKGKPGYEGVLNDRVAALPEILQGLPSGPLNDTSGKSRKGAYRTLLSGKWHLGLTRETSPWARGFEKSWSLLPGAGNHYKYLPRNEDGAPALAFIPPLYAEDDRLFDESELPDNFYSSRYFVDKLIGFWEESKKEDDDRPFFAALTLTAPHWPLQADANIIAKYKGVYDSGPEALREKRLAALVKLGLIPAEAIQQAYPALQDHLPRHSADWADLSENDQKYSSKLMQVYAAMVEQLDTEVGRAIDYLEREGKLDNTFVLFMSDNGAEGALLEAIPIMGEHILQTIEKHYDNSIDNIGNPNSWTWYGEKWAVASTAPARLFKTHISEGGIRCPCIVRYPGFGDNWQGGAVSHEFTTVMDILPTVLELSGVKHPGKQFQNRQVLQPRGKSWVPYLSGRVQEVHDKLSVHGWELFGQQAIRQGPWKALYIPGKTVGKDRWELYNLDRDAGEVNDLYLEEKDKLAELVDFWVTYVAETGTVVLADQPEYAGKARGFGFHK